MCRVKNSMSRAEQRFDLMLEQGALDEVRALPAAAARCSR